MQSVEDAGPTTVLHLSGLIDHDTAPILWNALEPPVEHSRNVIVHVAGVRFIDATGFRILEMYDQRAHERGCRVALAAPSPTVDRLIRLLKLDQVIPVFPSLSDALDAQSHRG